MLAKRLNQIELTEGTPSSEEAVRERKSVVASYFRERASRDDAHFKIEVVAKDASGEVGLRS